MSTNIVTQILKENRDLLLHPNIVSLSVDSGARDASRGGHRLIVGVIDASQGVPVPATLTTSVVGSGPLTITTVVREEGVIRDFATLTAPPMVAVRPVQGGSSILTASNRGTGTLGVNITYENVYRLLSNAHVLTQYDASQIGANIYQPAAISPENLLNTVTGQIPVTYYLQPPGGEYISNTYDFAWADITADLGSPQISGGVGTPAGYRSSPTLNETFSCCGAVSGYRTATVTSISAMYRSQGVNSQGQGVITFWESGLQTSEPVAQPGDSGTAMVATADNMVIGLIRSGSSTFSYGCMIPL